MLTYSWRKVHKKLWWLTAFSLGWVSKRGLRKSDTHERKVAHEPIPKSAQERCYAARGETLWTNAQKWLWALMSIKWWWDWSRLRNLVIWDLHHYLNLSQQFLLQHNPEQRTQVLILVSCCLSKFWGFSRLSSMFYNLLFSPWQILTELA